MAEAAVCGRADATTGQAVVAFVTVKGEVQPSSDLMLELCQFACQDERPGNW